MIHETYGIKQGLMSTVHAVTATQQVGLARTAPAAADADSPFPRARPPRVLTR